MSKYNDKAVALKYRKDRDRAPIVVAAGSGPIAQRIIEIADKKGVPIYKDTSAATLLSQLKIGEAIPVDLYNVVAGIYVCIMRMAGQLKENRKRDIGPDSISPVQSVDERREMLEVSEVIKEQESDDSNN